MGSLYKSLSTLAQKFSELQMLKQKVLQPFPVSPKKTKNTVMVFMNLYLLHYFIIKIINTLVGSIHTFTFYCIFHLLVITVANKSYRTFTKSSFILANQIANHTSFFGANSSG